MTAFHSEMQTSRFAQQRLSESYFDQQRALLRALTLFLVSLIWAPTVSVAILLLARVTPCWNPALALSALLLTVIACRLFRCFSKKQIVCLIVSLLIAILAAAVICIYFYDGAYDSRWYHADAVLALLKGINPIYTQIIGVEPVYANHYPKAAWYFTAFVIHFFHCYQIGKIYNFLLLFACGAYALEFFLRHKVNKKYSVVLAAATALTPVAATQIVSYFVDGFLVSLLTMATLAGVNLIFCPEKSDRPLFVLTVSLLIATKFTGLVFACAAIALLMAADLLYRKHLLSAQFRGAIWVDIINITAALSIGIVLIGYSPYITNIRQGLHPMYPVMGANKIDFLSVITPPALLGHGYNSIEKFLISFFAPTQLFSGAEIPMKIPFTVSLKEIICFGDPGVRIAGWGVFFSGVTLGSLVLFFLVRAWRGNAPFVLVLLMISVTGFINPECWRARYSPQIGLLPVFLLAAVLRSLSISNKKLLWIPVQILCFFLLLNSAVCAGAAFVAGYIKSTRLNQQFSTIAKTYGTGEYWAYRGEGYNVSKIHFEQFSGLKGIVLCAEIAPRNGPLPKVGSPVWMNMRNETEATLVKGSCSSPPPY